MDLGTDGAVGHHFSGEMELVIGAVSLGGSKALFSSMPGLAAQPGLWRMLGWTDARLI